MWGRAIRIARYLTGIPSDSILSLAFLRHNTFLGNTMKQKATINRSQAYRFAKHAMECDSIADVVAYARKLAKRCPGSAKRQGSWKHALLRFADMLERGELPHSIFAMEGNVKLPFVAFSALPVVTCPGAGACAGIASPGGSADLSEAFCYSLRAWRYPGAFLRQLQNTILLRFNRRAIIDAFKALPEGITMRLYVDGDFDSESTALFWFNLLRQRPDVDAYGYSKSWKILESIADRIPGNYVLNLSSGGIDDSAEYRERMRKLSATRGDFIALPIEGDFARGFARYKDPRYHRAVRAAAELAGLGKVFSCPGSCGECTGAGHACGATHDDGRFVMPISVVIGIH